MEHVQWNIERETQIMDDTLLMTSQAARILDRSAASVREYERKGLLHAMKTADGRRIFREDDVRKLAAELSRK